MSRYVLTVQAEQDIIEIASYISARNQRAAVRFTREAYDAFERLADRPGIGHVRRDITEQPVRFLTFRAHYMIVYRGEATPLQVLRVLSGYRDIAAILR